MKAVSRLSENKRRDAQGGRVVDVIVVQQRDEHQAREHSEQKGESGQDETRGRWLGRIIRRLRLEHCRENGEADKPHDQAQEAIE